jgi:hypothetical protein
LSQIPLFNVMITPHNKGPGNVFLSHQIIYYGNHTGNQSLS